MSGNIAQRPKDHHTYAGDPKATQALSDLCAQSKSLREATGEELAKKTYAMMDSGEIDHLLCCEIAERLRALTEIENTKRSR